MYDACGEEQARMPVRSEFHTEGAVSEYRPYTGYVFVTDKMADDETEIEWIKGLTQNTEYPLFLDLTK